MTTHCPIAIALPRRKAGDQKCRSPKGRARQAGEHTLTEFIRCDSRRGVAATGAIEPDHRGAGQQRKAIGSKLTVALKLVSEGRHTEKSVIDVGSASTVLDIVKRGRVA